jgi:hypothetical protein
MSVQYVSYANVTQAAASTLKTGPAKFVGFTVTASTSGSITVYDNTSAAGTVLFTKSSLTVGDVVHFGGFAIAAKNGLHVVVGGTGTVNVLYI